MEERENVTHFYHARSCRAGIVFAANNQAVIGRKSVF
jgi:hypothetical protein